MKNTRYILLLAAFFTFTNCNKDDDTITTLPPMAEFEISNTTPKVDEQIIFTNTSQHATSYEWDFGDGNSSTDENPVHSYASAGSFSVKLTATGEGGSDSASKVVTVMDATPIADFTINKTTAGIGERISFTNTSLNATEYEWDFGDGNMSIETNPTHEYDEAGNYTVKLVASNNGLENSIEKTVKIVIPVNIFPGDRIKGITLGEIWGSVKNMAGYDFTEFGPILTGGVWFHPVKEQSMGILFFLLGSGPVKSDSDQVVIVSVESPFIGTTDEGVGLGSTFADVKNAYGDQDEISNDNYRYTNLGIDFKIPTFKVEGITIYLP